MKTSEKKTFVAPEVSLVQLDKDICDGMNIGSDNLEPDAKEAPAGAFDTEAAWQ